eukprot:327534_1
MTISLKPSKLVQWLFLLANELLHSQLVPLIVLKPHHNGYVAFSVSSKMEIINVFMMELQNQIFKTAGIIQALSISTPAITFIGLHDVMVKINKMVILVFQYTG